MVVMIDRCLSIEEVLKALASSKSRGARILIRVLPLTSLWHGLVAGHDWTFTMSGMQDIAKIIHAGHLFLESLAKTSDRTSKLSSTRSEGGR